VLKTLKIKSNETCPSKPEQPKLDWNSEFLKDIRVVLKDHVNKCRNEIGGGKFANGPRLVGLAVVAVAVVLSFIWMLTGTWLAPFAFGFSCWVLCSNTFHDGGHFAMSKYWMINRFAAYCGPYISSPTSWDVHHVIAHHNLCNTEDDPDSRLFKVNYKRYKFTWILKFVFASIGLSIFVDLKAWLTQFFHTTPMDPHAPKTRLRFHLTGKVIWWIVSFGWPFVFTDWAISKCLFFAIIPWLCVGSCFGLFSQLSHLQMECGHPTEGAGDWYRLQCLTSVNYGRGPLFWLYFWLSGGLAMQIEHHLFPGVNHCQLPRLTEAVQRVCAKHKVPYRHFDGILDPLKRHIAYMSSLATINKSVTDQKIQ
jgi:fatty acid desaturase